MRTITYGFDKQLSGDELTHVRGMAVVVSASASTVTLAMKPAVSREEAKKAVEAFIGAELVRQSNT